MSRGTSTAIGIGLLLLLATSGRTADREFVWWEAEDYVDSNFPERHAFEPASAEEADRLSGGRWIGADGDHGKTLSARYEIQVATPGTYTFWVRKFWKHGPFRWRFDGGAWRTCDREAALAERMTLRRNVEASWVRLGEVELEKGRRSLRIELMDERGAACFDCFVLTRGTFAPRGRLKPGEKLGRAPEGWFAFEPSPDPFEEAAVDLRELNDARAGDRGFLRARGEEFVFEREGKPVRFWAANVSARSDDRAGMDGLARSLAKRGVNMVRAHRNVHRPGSAEIDEEYLDQLHYFVATMARQGIYTKLSLFFPLPFKPGPDTGIEGYENIENQSAFALLFFHARMQKIHRGWLRAVLTSENPYTGKSLAEDPALAILEIVNEDNLLFHTFKPYVTIPAECMPELERAFGVWLTKRYGSIAKARRAWGLASRGVRGDDDRKGRVGLRDAHHMTSRSPFFGSLRMKDQVRFLVERQRRFYEETVKYLRQDLGVKCLTVATNWTTADNRILGALDKYTNMACDVLDRHGYFGGPHRGEGASYSIRPGHTYEDRTALTDPASHPVRELTYAGFPHIVSEFNWPMPNRFRAEGPFLSAVYGALQGTDAYFQFAVNGTDWSLQHRKFSVSTPVTLGQFPALALLYRQGYVAEGPTVSSSALPLDDLFEMKGSPAVSPLNLDALRAADIPEGEAGKQDGPRAIDPLAWFAGRVAVRVGEGPGESAALDLSALIRREEKLVRSATGELVWDYGSGVVTVDAPCAQGAAGFLGAAGPIRLGDIVIEAGIEYGTVLAVSLDGAPIATSRRILLQVVTEDENFGWKASGGRIEEVGGAPIVVREISGKVTFQKAKGLKAVALDENLYESKELPAGNGKRLVVDLLRDRLYYLIR